MIKRGKFFFFLLLPLTREAVVSQDLIGTLLMDANGWTSSWQSPARAGTAGAAYSYQLFTLGCGSAWGQAKGSNPIFACWRFLPLRIALRNIIDRKKNSEFLYCCGYSGHLTGSHLREEGLSFTQGVRVCRPPAQLSGSWSWGGTLPTYQQWGREHTEVKPG